MRKTPKRNPLSKFPARWPGRPFPECSSEARCGFLSSYEGIGLNNANGNALYVGPSFFTNIGEQAYFKVAYGYQVAGWSPESDDDLDLVGHDRQQLEVKFGIEF